MSIAAQCPDCCVCPTASVQWDSRSASKTVTLANLFEDDGGYYKTKTTTDTYTCDSVVESGTAQFGCPGPLSRFEKTIDGVVVTVDSRDLDGTETSTGPVGTVDVVYTNYFYGGECGCGVAGYGVVSVTTQSFACYEGGDGAWTSSTVDTTQVYPVCSPVTGGPYDTSGTGCMTGGIACDGESGGSDSVVTYSDAFTVELFYDELYAQSLEYDDDWDDTAGSFRNHYDDEDTESLSIRESRYRLRFQIPKVNTGLNYRVLWVERFIAEVGVGVSSIEVYSAGVYRPAVTISGGSGSGAQAVALMSSTGTVTGIRILNPGSGYTTAPTVAVGAAVNGGTTSTGWVASVSGGQVTGAASGSAGNYRPTFSFSGDGTGAAATCTLDEQGGMASVSVTAGSGYTEEPVLTVSSKVASPTAADLLIHLGFETARCAVWDGVAPGGYSDGDASTWPVLPSASPYYFELAVPAADGTTLVANVRAVCDGTACP